MRFARLLAASMPFVGAGVLVIGCAFKNGVLVSDLDGGASARSYGPRGMDERFAWDEHEVKADGLVWEREASAPLSLEEARARCGARLMRVPTREELLSVSDVLGGDLFPGREGIDWHWSDSPGSRAGTAWAVGLAGYANANDVTAKSLVRCVR